MPPKLSILIPVHTQHLQMFNELFEYLKKQVRDLKAEDEVEIIYEVDAGQISTGIKRNNLLKQAKGEYIVTIDADDWVTEYYLKEMLIAIKTGCDCVGIKGWMTTDGGKYIEWELSKDFQNVTVKKNGVDFYKRKTNHITAVRRELALKAMFTDKKRGEDSDYSEALHPFLKTETKVSPLLYHYRFTTQSKLY